VTPAGAIPSSVSGGNVFDLTGTQAGEVRAVVAFFDSYDRRELSGALYWLTADVVVGDCDYRHQAFIQFLGKPRAQYWLLDRFADHDSVVVRRLFDANADQPVGVVILDWTRTSDTLGALGRKSGVQGQGAKIAFDSSEPPKIRTLGLASPGRCPL
jgi:hypothetical protein